MPLRWESALRLEGSRYNIDVDPAMLSKAAHFGIAVRANQIWHDYVEVENTGVSLFNSYLSFYAIVGVVWTRLIIEQTLAHFKPENIWIPVNPYGLECVISEDEDAAFFDFNKWISYEILKEISNESGSVDYFPERPRLSIDQVNSYTPWALGKSNLLVERVLSRLNKGKKLMQSFIARIKYAKVSSRSNARVLVIGQSGKKVLLEELLSAEGISFISLDDVPHESSSTVHIVKGASVAELLDSFLETRDLILVKQLPQIRKFAHEQHFDVLLTDHQYDAKTRILMHTLGQSHKTHIAIFPEGAASHTFDHFPFSKFWHYWQANLTYFVVSNKDAAYHDRVGLKGDHLVTGYLGNTFHQHLLLETFIKWYFKFKEGFSGSDKSTVFVSFEVYEGWIFPQSMSGYQAATFLLEQLVKDGYRVVAKMRHGSLLTELRKKFPTVLFFQRLPWQVLARNCDVVIQSDSSIGIEALALKIPVIVWKPFDYPMYSDAYSDIQSDVVRKVTQPEDLDQAIRQLIDSPKLDFGQYEQFQAQEHHRVVDWVREKLTESSPP